MMRVIIIEDERLIAEELKKMLISLPAAINVEAVFSTVRDSVSYLNAQNKPDLIFSDVQLADGVAFEIFDQVQVTSPIVFITAYDEFVVNAFAVNSIDYLLKPVEITDLQKAIDKYNSLESHFSTPDKFLQSFVAKRRKKLIVKKGLEYIPLGMEDIVLFFTESKIVFVTDKEGKKYFCEKSLSELEVELDQQQFFRANRQYIVNLEYIKGYKPYKKVKVQVDLIIPDLDHRIIVSQETAPDFRSWISQA